MTEDHKWVILIRDGETDPWRPFAHYKTGRPYQYADIDKANWAAKNVIHHRFRRGNAKIERADRAGVA